MKRHTEKLVRRSAAALAAVSALSLAGCSVRTGSPDASVVSMASISGTVHGGQQPVSGARVYMFAVNTSGYGNNAQSILVNPGYVTTTSGGAFSITGAYTCPSNAQVYLAAFQGNPGLAAGTNNASLNLVAGLGSCSALTSATNVTINEVSTAAMTYALAGFMSNYVQVSTSASNAPGIARAFASIPNMINVATGTVLTTTPGGNGTVPAAEINTLADVIAPCVNSPGNDGNCAALFAATTPAGGTAPTDTVSALLSIAQNPGNNVAQIYNLVAANSPFQPTLTSAPNDWTVALNYTGGGLSNPYGLAIDIAGNVWATNPSANSVTQLNYVGVPQATFTGNGLNSPRGISTDIPGNAFVANFTANNVVRISNANIISTFTGGGLSNPSDVAVDGNNMVYVANQAGNSISAFSPSGAPVNANGYIGGGLNGPTSIAVDGTGQIVATNLNGNSVTKLTSAGVFASATGFMGAGITSPVGVALDASNNIFVANTNTTVSKLSSTGVAASGSPISGGGTGTQAGIAIDGAGNIFVSDVNNSIKVINGSNNTAKSPSTGFQGGGMNSPGRLLLDVSGNLWVVNSGASAGSITEFIGIGAPTASPLASAINTGKVGARP